MSLAARLRALLRRGGGTMPNPPPLAPGEERVILSPGRFELPEGAEGQCPDDFLERLNQPRRKPTARRRPRAPASGSGASL